MKAVIFEGAYEVEVRDKERPGIAEPTDALLRVTTAAICGSDLHMYDGRTAMETGHILGHEIMGVIEQVGPAVRSIKAGNHQLWRINRCKQKK